MQEAITNRTTHAPTRWAGSNKLAKAINDQPSAYYGRGTINELADRTGMQATSISRLINHGGNPTYETLAKLAEALDLPITELI